MAPPAILNFDHLLPEGETLFDYQHVGVAYALVARRTFIADEQGLGKTRQALVAVEADGVFGRGGQVVIVCPARLKDNWLREVTRLLPHRSVQILGGKRPYETFADVIIVNYDILSAWGEFLSPEALVLDESHYVKEIKSQRTKAARKLAARVPSTGLVLALTGTPILNRPVELFAQLDILGQLRQVAPKPRKGDSDKDWEYAFKFTYCGPKHNGHGYEFKGASNLGRLNEALRSTCFVRRERKDVLGMEETRRIQVPLSLNGALDRYRSAERNLIGFLAGEKGQAAADKARNAEVLVGLNTLRKLAGEAKVEAAIEWINNFFEENEGRSLVVFASHIEVQEALVAAFPGCSQILGGQRDVEAQKDRFLAGETNLIVCSLQAAREGHTLVGPNIDCHDVLFVEQGWNPGSMSQAEDRINRIGQTAQWVFAHILFAADTIDEWLAEIIATKAATHQAGIVGVEVEAAESSVQDEILARLIRKGEAARG